MTRLKLKGTIGLILSFFISHSQTVLNGHLTDLHKRPITFAVIKYGNSTFNSDNAGFFRISNYKLGSKISIHKLGFADTSVAVALIPAAQDSLNLHVILRLQPMILPEIAISSALIKEVNPMNADFVLGYELKGENLLQLLSNQILVINEENKVTCRSHPIQGVKDIVKDAYGTIYVTTDKKAYKIESDGSFIRIDTLSIDLANLMWNITYCEDINDTSIFIRRYKDYNQTIAFFAISSLNLKHVRQLKEISDVHRKNTVLAFANESNSLNKYVASLGLSKASAATEAEIKLVRAAQNMADRLEMNYVLPSYSLLKLVNDSLCLFAHDIDTMFIYDQKWNLVKSKRLYYHHLKTWGGELFVNEEKTKVYAKLIQKSKFMIAEVDLQSGMLKSAPITLKATFPTKIKIRKNVVYFMAKSKSGGYTIYSQKL
jgi:hypothetical protein